MAQSLSKVYIHLIFSTKNRERTLRDEIRPDLHAYIGGILRDLDSPSIEINTEPDHAHVLFILVPHAHDQRRGRTGKTRLLSVVEDEGPRVFSIPLAEWIWSLLGKSISGG